MEFIKTLNKIELMSPELNDHLSGIVKTVTIKKNEYLLKAGEVCKNIYFVKEGLLSWFLKRKDGTDCYYYFMHENDVIYVIKGFKQQQPGEYSIQALEDCTLQYISHSDSENVCKHFPEFLSCLASLTDRYILLEERLFRVARTPNLLKRYQLLMQYQPEYIRRVPDKLIASFLRVPETKLKQLKKLSKQSLTGNIKL